jgi:hypothetical protein
MRYTIGATMVEIRTNRMGRSVALVCRVWKRVSIAMTLAVKILYRFEMMRWNRVEHSEDATFLFE